MASFLNWAKLEEHFKTDHFPCQNPSCLEKKFIVFGSQMDLQAHMVDEHGDSMTAKDKRGARRVEVPFGFANEDVRRSDGAHTNRSRAGGGPSSNPPEPPPPPQQQQPAGQNRPPVGGSRRANFGGQLTSGDGAPVRNLPSSNHAALPRTDVDQQTLE